MKPRTLAALALALGCSADTLDPIVIDVSNNCPEIEVQVAMTVMESPQLRVLQAAADGPALDSAWLLVERATPGAGAILTLEHVGPGGQDGAVPLGLAGAEADLLSLRAGPTPGEAWLLERAPGHLQITRVRASTDAPPTVTRSFELGSFPSDDSCDEDGDGSPDPCDTTDWPRELIFLQGTPYLLSVPPESISLSLRVHLSRLQDDLSPIPINDIVLVIECPDDLPPEALLECQERLARYRWSAIELIGVQSDPRPAAASIVLRREEEEDGLDFVGSDVLHLELGIASDGQPSGLQDSCIGVAFNAPCQIQPESGVPAGGPPSGVAVDGYDAYALFASMSGGSQLWHLPDASPPVPLDDELGDDIALLQLDRDIAIGRLAGGTWEITKVFPDAPEQSVVTTWGTNVDAVAQAGPGSFLAHEEGEALLVHLPCRD
jgi:hypothetical protein